MSKKDTGQLLIESLVAITIISIAILGIFTLSSRSISLNRVVSDQYTANYLAAEGIEVVKNIIDTNVVYDCKGWNVGLGTLGYDYTVNYNTSDSGPADTSAVLEKFSNNKSPLYIDDGIFNNQREGEPTKFYRKVRLEQGNNINSIRVISTVSWENRGGAEFDVVLEDLFYNWRPFDDNCI